MKYPERSQYRYAKKSKCRVGNWSDCNESLRRRGDLTVWFDEDAIAAWEAENSGKPGGQRKYSDVAIEMGLVVRMIYRLGYRQAQGFLTSVVSLLGLKIDVPDYSTFCRRSKVLRKRLRTPKGASNQPIHLMIDSTGLKIHVGSARKPSASADSAYDKESVYQAIERHSPGRRTRVIIEPQRNAVLSAQSKTAMPGSVDSVNDRRAPLIDEEIAVVVLTVADLRAT